MRTKCECICNLLTSTLTHAKSTTHLSRALERTGRTGRDRTGPRITSSLFLFEKRWSVAPKQAFGQKVVECCSKASFCSKSDGVLFQNELLLQKWWSVAPKQAFAPKVMECCSKTSFCSKSEGVLLQNELWSKGHRPRHPDTGHRTPAPSPGRTA